MKRFKVGIIGATGMVGQQFINLLEGHPWFEITNLSASARSAGKPYKEAIEGRWKLAKPCPAYVQDLPVYDAEADISKIASEVDMVFCAVDMDKKAIRELEEAYADAGVAVISNNSAHRWTDDIPMLIPEVNAYQTKLIDVQRKRRGWTTGLIAVKPNCSIQSYTIVLSALSSFQPQFINVTSLQAVSGAGRTLASWPEMNDNAIPYIGGEEEKSEREPLQIWGDLVGDNLVLAHEPKITATCIRIPVSDGHMADVSVRFATKPSLTEIQEAIDNFKAPLKELNLPSSPDRLIHLTEEPDRPQINLDRDLEKGMGVSLGRLRELASDDFFDWRFISLAHNTVRGAAGGAILMAELLAAQDYIINR